jgi:hypothetical protein
LYASICTRKPRGNAKPIQLTPETFFPVAQHFTVAELRAALGIDAQPVGLGDDITRAFPGVSVAYRHQP